MTKFNWNSKKSHTSIKDETTQRQQDQAAEAYRSALSVVEGVAEQLRDDQLREIFLSSEPVKGMRESAAAVETGPKVQG